MKNRLSDLNNYLFESIERLMDDETSDEEFEKERNVVKPKIVLVAIIMTIRCHWLNHRKGAIRNDICRGKR